MQRSYYLTMEAIYKDLTVRATFSGGSVKFHCPDVSEKYFATAEQALAAIDVYVLSLRKDFTNTTAYYLRGYRDRQIETVTVTSVAENGKEAWVKNAAGRREKVEMRSLYSNKVAVMHYLAQREKAVEEFERQLAVDELVLNNPAHLWQPEKGNDERV